MAEGGIIQKQDRVRPLLPPKPTGCLPTQNTASTAVGASSVRSVTSRCGPHTKYSHEHTIIEGSEKIVGNIKSSTYVSGLNQINQWKDAQDCDVQQSYEEKCGEKLKSPKRSVTTRPQILPKPQTPFKSQKSPERTENIKRGFPQNKSNSFVTEKAATLPSETFLQKPNIINKHIFTNVKTNETKEAGAAYPRNVKLPSNEIKSHHALHIRAPVANFEEFDCLPESGSNNVPIRPPRSPKIKASQGNIFFRCIESNLFLNSRDKLNKPKPQNLSLNKTEAKGFQKSKQLEIKLKSSSLGRFSTGYLSQFYCTEVTGDENDKVPVPPPRRRRKSVTDVSPTKDLGSKQVFPVFAGDTRLQSTFPEYATVNYSQKRNRIRNDVEHYDHCSGQIPARGLQKNLSHDPDVHRPNLHSLKEIFEVGSRSNEIKSHKQTGRLNTCDSDKNVPQLSKVAGDIMDTSASKTLSETSRIDKAVSSNTDNSMSSAVVIKVDNKDKAAVAEGKLSECNSQYTDCPQSTEQESHPTHCKIKDSSSFSNGSDMCGTCIEEKSVSELHDSSGSSKVEWLSVSGSLHNTSGEIEKKAVDVKSSCKEHYEAEIDLSNENSMTSILLNNTPASGKQFGQDISRLVVSDTSSEVSAIQIHINSNVVNTNTFTENKHTIISKLKTEYQSSNGRGNSPFGIFSEESLTSSTPSLPNSLSHRNAPANKKHMRRLSWSGCRERCTATKNESQGRGKSLSLWHDDGDLSSGALADLDSSDNTARHSSLDEVFLGSDCDITKKLPLYKVYSKYQEGLLHNEDCVSVSSSSQDNEYCVAAKLPVDSSANISPNNSERNCGKQEEHSDQERTDNTETSQHSDSEAAVSCSKVSQQKTKKAFYIAEELMKSERVFISVLKLLNVDFRQAVDMAKKQYQAQVIPEDDLSKIFNSLPQLQSLNEDLLHDLEIRIENWQSCKKIADVIVRKGPFLKLYATYIQNFEVQCNHFDECCQKYPKFYKLVKDFEALPLCQKLSVKHFMLKPVQRIPQYRLLLDEYFRQLEPSSPDYDDTQRALKIVSDVADHANRSIKLGDHLSKLLQLQAQLNNYEIIKPGRIFLKEGELLKLSRKDSQPRYFILLNDCLLYTSYYGSGLASGLKVNSELPLGGMKVSTPQAEDFHNEFSIISSTRSFTLMARSQEERQEWVDALQAAIKDYTHRQLSFHKLNSKDNESSSETFKLGKEVPVWIQDGRVTKCQSCVAVFTVTFRRHHCRACGKVVCSNCSDFRAPLQYKRFQPDRVCVDCYDILLAEFENEGRMKHCIEIELKLTDYEDISQKYREIKSHFKKLGPNGRRKFKKYVPQRLLEVTANDTGSQMSGWLLKRKKNAWKRYWFVLKDRILYVYKASEDVAALETIPVLGYEVEQMKEVCEGRDPKLVFLLTHEGQAPLMFSADSLHSANRWISALQDATVLKE